MEQQFNKYLFGELSTTEKVAFEAMLSKDKAFQENYETYQSHLIEAYVFNRVSEIERKKIEVLASTNSSFAKEIEFNQKFYKHLDIYSKQKAVKKTILDIRKDLSAKKEKEKIPETNQTQSLESSVNQSKSKNTAATSKEKPKQGFNKTWLLLLFLTLGFLLWKSQKTPPSPPVEIFKELESPTPPPLQQKTIPNETRPVAATQEAKEEKLLGSPNKKKPQEQVETGITASTKPQEIKKNRNIEDQNKVQQKENISPVLTEMPNESSLAYIDIESSFDNPFETTTRGANTTKQDITPLEQANLAYKNKEWKNADQLFQKILDKEKVPVEVLFKAGFAALNNKKWNRSIDLFNQVIENDTEGYKAYAEWHKALALCKTGAKGYDKAKEMMETINTSGHDFQKEAQIFMNKHFK